MNNVNLIGRTTKEPAIHKTEGEEPKTVARFTLAVDRMKREEADYIPCVAFGKTAEFVEKYVKKGVRIGVSGRLQSGSYTNKDNVKVYTLDCIAERVEFADGKRENVQEGETGDGFINIPDGIDEELPFN